MNQEIESLQHTQVPIVGGGEIFVMDTGAAIGPEADAMLQALHSRSTGGFKKHLDILAKKGPDSFMASFYVGYGHKSIGDCGTTTIFIEGVSMLAAKAIQDWPLYSGQEASTRYIDFQKQKFANPLGTEEGNVILEKWRTFYSDSMEAVKEHLKQQFPLGEGEEEKTYNKAIAARAFDILRGTLPAGATTNLAWHTNLRQAADKLMMLRHHPLQEVRNTAEAIEQGLKKAYPNSFIHKRYVETERYNGMLMREAYYFHDPNQVDFEVISDRIEKDKLPRQILESRPPKTELPKHVAEYGDIMFGFQLDFGSFRDIQRHRAVSQRMPLLTMDIGFEQWYLDELPENVRENLKTLLAEQKTAVENIGLSKEDKQYYIAMGYNTSNRIVGNLGALLYLTELRATRFVHPTLSKRAIQMAEYLKETYSPYGLAVHLDSEPNQFDIKRGKHDIEIK